jgi:hypothetical protein
MSITWFNDKPKNLIATIHENHITLNKTATTYFENAYQVMLGFDKANDLIIIKPLTKDLAMKNTIPNNQKYKITVKSSYSRVTNKAFVNEIINIFELNLNNDTIKYRCYFDETNNQLNINIKEAIV